MTPCLFEEEVRVKVLDRSPLTDPKGYQLVLAFFGLNSGKDGIVKKYGDYAERIGRPVVPVAEDGLGNLFVFDPVSGAVLFWHHECQEGESSPMALTQVSSSYDEFVSGLEPFDDPTPVTGIGIKRVSLDF